MEGAEGGGRGRGPRKGEKSKAWETSPAPKFNHFGHNNISLFRCMVVWLGGGICRLRLHFGGLLVGASDLCSDGFESWPRPWYSCPWTRHLTAHCFCWREPGTDCKDFSKIPRDYGINQRRQRPRGQSHDDWEQVVVLHPPPPPHTATPPTTLTLFS